jgi:hypothetical protein
MPLDMLEQERRVVRVDFDKIALVLNALVCFRVPFGAERRVDEDVVEDFAGCGQERRVEARARVCSQVVGDDALEELGCFGSVEGN